MDFQFLDFRTQSEFFPKIFTQYIVNVLHLRSEGQGLTIHGYGYGYGYF